MQPDGIVLSPGPGHPADKKSFGICGDIIENYWTKNSSTRRMSWSSRYSSCVWWQSYQCTCCKTRKNEPK